MKKHNTHEKDDDKYKIDKNRISNNGEQLANLRLLLMDLAIVTKKWIRKSKYVDFDKLVIFTSHYLEGLKG